MTEPLAIGATAATAVVEVVKGGQVAVVPTAAGYALLADAFHPGAIAIVRMAKAQGVDIPLPVAVAEPTNAAGVAVLAGAAADLAQAFWPGPLTLLVPAQPSLNWRLGPNDAALAITVPDDDFLRSILRETGPCVLTGAQPAESSPIGTVDQAAESVGSRAALFVDGGPRTAAPSSVVDTTGVAPRLLREGALTLAQLRGVYPGVVDATGRRRGSP